jgi:glycosyltransferase involved in cell wall biosynthesis
VTFLGAVDEERLRPLRAEAAVALVPSRSGETFGLAAAEAMAAGVPVVAARVGALPELVPDDWLVPAGDAAAMAGTIERVLGDASAGARARERAWAVCAPEAVAASLAAVYGG